jgi:hypothetical protein
MGLKLSKVKGAAAKLFMQRRQTNRTECISRDW